MTLFVYTGCATAVFVSAQSQATCAQDQASSSTDPLSNSTSAGVAANTISAQTIAKVRPRDSFGSWVGIGLNNLGARRGGHRPGGAHRPACATAAGL